MTACRLNIAAFPEFPARTVLTLGPQGEVLGSTAYTNTIFGRLRNPRSNAWNVELDRQVLDKLAVRIAYQNRNTRDAFVVNPSGKSLTGVECRTRFLPRVSDHGRVSGTTAHRERFVREVPGIRRSQRLQSVLRQRSSWRSSSRTPAGACRLMRRTGS